MEIVNLTNKPITIVDEYGQMIKTYAPDGNAWCESTFVKIKTVDDVPVFEKRYGKVHNLPAPETNASLERCFIVTDEVAEAVKDFRFDVVVPAQPVNVKRNHYRSLLLP